MMDTAGARMSESDTPRDAATFEVYLHGIVHQWNRTLTMLGITLVPAFFLLDMVIIPSDYRALLPRFGMYRFATTAAVVLQHWVIRRSLPTARSYWHGYFFTFVVSAAIVKMTTELGGFDSGYYAGLILVSIAANAFMPWRVVHSILNGLMIIAMYVVANTLMGTPGSSENLVSNLFFMAGSNIIAVAITHHKYKLLQQEFQLRAELAVSNAGLASSERELKLARDALWAEIEVARRIQTALLPSNDALPGLEIAATMIPAKEVGGDYYDLIPTPEGQWILIGDVSGHGVESGLIMMMVQTSVRSIIHSIPDVTPARLLTLLNPTIKENIAKLGSSNYMTISALLLRGDELILSGMHQDVMIHRHETRTAERVRTEGVWIGVIDDCASHFSNLTVKVHPDDVVLLFTDGITEARDASGELFDDDRLEAALRKYAELPAARIVDEVIREVMSFQQEQRDDITLVVARHLGPGAG